jgi:hypothetical protein
MSLRKKSTLFSFLGTAFLTALLSLALSSCVPGAGPGASPGGGIANPLSGGGNLTGGGGIENAATGDSSKGDGKNNDNSTGAGDGEGDDGDAPTAFAYNYVDGGNSSKAGASGNLLPGTIFPDPQPHPGKLKRAISFDPVKEKNVCVVSSGESGKRVKVKLVGTLIVKPLSSNGRKLRIVDKKDNEYLDTKETHRSGGVDGRISFTLTITLPLRIQIYDIPRNVEADETHSELPCGDSGPCVISDHYLVEIWDYPGNLHEVADHAPDCSSNDQEDDPSNDD